MRRAVQPPTVDAERPAHRRRTCGRTNSYLYLQRRAAAGGRRGSLAVWERRRAEMSLISRNGGREKSSGGQMDNYDWSFCAGLCFQSPHAAVSTDNRNTKRRRDGRYMRPIARTKRLLRGDTQGAPASTEPDRPTISLHPAVAVTPHPIDPSANPLLSRATHHYAYCRRISFQRATEPISGAARKWLGAPYRRVNQTSPARCGPVSASLSA